MAEPVIPKPVEEFILARIESVTQLEALLLMRRLSTQGWTSEELAGQLYIKQKDADIVLTKMVSHGLCVQREGAFWFEPESAELNELVGDLAATYKEKLIPVTNLIHQRASKPAVQQFADVFRFRKDG